MEPWRQSLLYDPMPAFLESGDPALEYAARRDLLDERVGPPAHLWRLKRVERLLRKQQKDGSWKYPGGGRPHLQPVEDYNQIETYRFLGELVEVYAADTDLPGVCGAAEFLFSCQTDEGDFRGIYGAQYTPNYTAAILELLVKAGFGQDPRVEKAFKWLLSIRQGDGGWAIPLTTAGARWDPVILGGETIEPDRSKPFSHMVTGVALRAFAAHPLYRQTPEARAAAQLLASRFFQKDPHPGRNTPDFWTRFSFPFWFTDLVSALDSLSWIGPGREHPSIRSGLDWLAGRQSPGGIWELAMVRSGNPLWLSLAICRVLKRYEGESGE